MFTVSESCNAAFILCERIANAAANVELYRETFGEDDALDLLYDIAKQIGKDYGISRAMVYKAIAQAC